MKQKRTSGNASNVPAKPAPKPAAKPATKPKNPVAPEILAFCADLRRRRKDAGITLEALAKRCTLTPNYIGTIEKSYRDPSLSSLEAVAKAHGVPVGELFGPTKELGPKATEMAKMFSRASDPMQAGILKLLRAVTKK